MSKILDEIRLTCGSKHSSEITLEDLAPLFVFVLECNSLDRRMDQAIPLSYTRLLARIQEGIRSCGIEGVKRYQFYPQAPQSVLTAIATFYVEEALSDHAKGMLKLGELFEKENQIFINIHASLAPNQSQTEATWRQNIPRRMQAFAHGSMYLCLVFGVLICVSVTAMFMHSLVDAAFAYMIDGGVLNTPKLNYVLKTNPFIMIGWGDPKETGTLLTDRNGDVILYHHRTDNDGLYATQKPTSMGFSINNGTEFRVSCPDEDILREEDWEKCPSGKGFKHQFFENGGDCSPEFLKAMNEGLGVQCRALFPNVVRGHQYDRVMNAFNFSKIENYYIPDIIGINVLYAAKTTAMAIDFKENLDGKSRKTFFDTVRNQVVFTYLMQIPFVAEMLNCGEDRLFGMFSDEWHAVRSLYTTIEAFLTVWFGFYMLRVGTLVRVVELFETHGLTHFGEAMRLFQRMVVLNHAAAIRKSWFNYVIFPCSLFSALCHWNSWMLYVLLIFNLFVLCCEGSVKFLVNSCLVFREHAPVLWRIAFRWMGWSDNWVKWLFGGTGVTGLLGFGGYHYVTDYYETQQLTVGMSPAEKKVHAAHQRDLARQAKADKAAEKAAEKLAAKDAAKLAAQALKTAKAQAKTANAVAARQQQVANAGGGGNVAPAVTHAVAPAVSRSAYSIPLLPMLFHFSVVSEILQVFNAVFVLYTENIHAFVVGMWCAFFMLNDDYLSQIRASFKALRGLQIRASFKALRGLLGWKHAFFWAVMLFIYIRAYGLRKSPFQIEYWRWPMPLWLVKYFDVRKHEAICGVDDIISTGVFKSYLLFHHGFFISSGGITVITRGVVVLALHIWNGQRPITQEAYWPAWLCWPAWLR